MQINQTENVPAKLYDELDFVQKQDVAAGSETWAYDIECPEDYGIIIRQGTPVAPRFVNVNGEKVDASVSVTLQKYTTEGYPVADGIVFEDTFDAFDYEEMRIKPAKMRRTKKPLALEERESLRVLLNVPSGAADFDASASKLTIGEDTTNVGKPVSIKSKSEMTQPELGKLKAAAQNGGN
jgi:hypothetical protein